jgi:hypothetical protein
MSFQEFLNLSNENFTDVVKYHMDERIQARIVTDFPISYTGGKRPLMAFDVDKFLTPDLYSNTLKSLRKNILVRQNFEHITDLEAEASEDPNADVRSFDPFVQALVDCKITASELDRACYIGGKTSPPVAGSRRIMKEGSNLYDPILESMSLRWAVYYFGRLHYGITDCIGSEAFFKDGFLSWIDMCTGEVKALKMREFQKSRGRSEIYNWKGSDDKVWDGKWASGILDWFTWANKDLEGKALDLKELQKYKGIISINCPPISSDIYPYTRVLLGLPRAVVFSSMVSPNGRVLIQQTSEALEQSVCRSDVTSFLQNLSIFKQLMDSLFVEIKSGILPLKQKLEASIDQNERTELLKEIWARMKRNHLELNLTGEYVDEMQRINREYSRFRNFGWGFFPYSFSQA